MLDEFARIRNAKSGRFSSWNKKGTNHDAWKIPAGETVVLADIRGPGIIKHIWMTQRDGYRECLLRITWDNARSPSVLVPLGDFFCLGHGMVNSFQSLFFSGSARPHWHNNFNKGCALNCYLPMPFKERALVELINQKKGDHRQYFYVDYEQVDELDEDMGYLHAEFRRQNPFGGWGHEMRVNVPEVKAYRNKGETAWNNNYVICDTKGKGHYAGCNLSVTNFQGTWWGEGDDMIWVDGYKWPPDLHGTGSEDYLNQAWGMQDNAFLRNGSSIFEDNTGGYQTSYVFHVENPVHFNKSLKVTIEHGHGNHLANEMSSTAYWYARKPTKVVKPPAVSKRMPVLRDNSGNWLYDKRNQCPGRKIQLDTEMKRLKKKWQKAQSKD
jgi:hypothetical protein